MKGRLGLLAAGLLSTGALFAERTVVNGQVWECRDGKCVLVSESPEAGEPPFAAFAPAETDPLAEGMRLAQGYMEPEEFLAFLEGREPVASEESGGETALGFLALLFGALVAGLAMNLTPCVLPMMPVNLIVIGRSARRGAAYGLGIALAYGALGLAAAFGGMAFGEIQGSPWFNLAVALVFVALALALFGTWFLDFSKGRTRFGGGAPFALGALSAVLAGACVAPVLVSVLLVTANLSGRGNGWAALLPLAMGVGMGLPWPLAGAGLKILPKPGAWMTKVNRAFGVVVLGFAAWYGYLAAIGFASRAAAADRVSPADFAAALAAAPRPVLVECGASWCKSCTAMEHGTLRDPRVAAELKRFTVIQLDGEDVAKVRALPGFGELKGLPAFAIIGAASANGKEDGE